VILWSAAEPDRLPQNVADELENPSNELWFSPISVWEILLLAEKRYVSIGSDTEEGVRNILRRIPVKEAVLNVEVAIHSRFVNLPHQDPADRFLVATAIVYDLTIVTADTRIINAVTVPILPAI
jgi:PIN domain nuclease of toxin-antitoxin system